MALPPLASLRAFDAAARSGSFSRAAREIHVTPSAVSYQMKALENDLGTKLFVRNGRRDVTLTREGEFLSERVDRALAILREAAETLRRHRNRLTVSVLPSFAARWLMPRIGRFMDQHPGLDLSVQSTTAHAAFAPDGVDLAIRFGAGHWPNMRSRLIMSDSLFPVCSPALLRDRQPGTPSELAEWTWLEGDPEGWSRWFAAAGADLPNGKRRLDVGDASLALQAAIDGAGIAMTRRSIAERELANGTVVRLLPAISAAAQYSYYFVWPLNVDLSPPAVAFIAWILAEVAGPSKA
jgi:LysR family glycine cleavage system transcriptional activator